MGDDGKTLVDQLVTVGNDTYYVDGSGKMATDRFATTTDGTFFFDADGKKVVSEFVTDESGTYYVDENGEILLEEFITIGDDVYYVDADGRMVTGQFVQDGEEEFYFGADGKKVKSRFVKDETGTYYMDEDGKKVANQFVSDETGTYYMDTDGKMAKDRFVTDETGTYYVDTDGKMVTNRFATAGDDTFYFGADGRKVVSQFVTDESGTYYVDADGRKVTNQIVSDGSGTYYVDAGGKVVTNRFVPYEGKTLYFGEDGRQAFNRWIEVEGKFRYVNGKGIMLVNVKKAAGGYYGNFDRDGYWTAIENTFFDCELDDGTVAMKYAGKEGKIAGIGEGMANSRHYGFVRDADGTVHCYLFAVGGDALTEESVAGAWIGDLWVNGAGILCVGEDSVEIDGKYYNFDENGHGSLIVNSLIFDKEGGIVCYAGKDGSRATDQFVTVGGKTLYFGADGSQVFHRWISVGDKFRYVDGKGHMLANVTKLAGRYYGRFDAEGYWTAIENTFFDDKLEDGTAVMKYSGKAGEVAGIGDKMENWKQYVFMKEKSGAVRCRLLAVGGDSFSDEPVADLWIDDMRVNQDGYLVIAADEPVDGVYYRFDKDGHGTLITYKITYVLDGGRNSDANPASYTGASEPIVLQAPAKTGYIFDGWYLEGGYSSKITGIASKSHGDLTLYAKWLRTSVDNDDDDDDSGSGSSGGSVSTGGAGAGNAEAGNANVGSVNTGSGEATVTVKAGDGPNVTVQAGETVVSAAAAQTSEGSVSGNTIISTAETAAVPLSDGQAATIATIAVSADGSARTLLAVPVQGATVQQKTLVVQGAAVTQNVVVYADGTQVAQKSGAAELEGFTESVVSVETAIKNGSQTVAAAYSDKAGADLRQYQQIGAAVTYEVTAGVNGAVPQVQTEQTNLAPGQEIAALITDASGNVAFVTVVVGANGIIQYQIPGANCIVRFMRKI